MLESSTLSHLKYLTVATIFIHRSLGNSIPLPPFSYPEAQELQSRAVLPSHFYSCRG